MRFYLFSQRIYLAIIIASCFNIVGCGGVSDKAIPAEVFSDKRVAALTEAAEIGDVAKIDDLVRQGVDVNAKGRGNKTPLLHSFTRAGYEGLIGSIKDEPENREQAACFEGYKALLRHDADPNILDQEGAAVMLLAAQQHDPKWLREAIAHRGNANIVNIGNRHSPNSTPLFYAIGFNRVENVRLLVAAGANLEHRDSYQLTPMLMSMPCNFEIGVILVEAGADFRTKNQHGQDAVYLLASNVNVSGFKEYVASPSLTDNDRKWFLKLCDALKAKGANLNFRD